MKPVLASIRSGLVASLSTLAVTLSFAHGEAHADEPVTFVPSASRCGAEAVCAPPGRDFPEVMKNECRARGGGPACGLPRWNGGFYREILDACVSQKGLELCTDLRCGDAKDSICSADLGPFPQPMIDLCLAAGGGDKVCATGSWERAFFESLLNACIRKNGVEACVSEASKAFGRQSLAVIGRWPEQWNVFIDEALEDPRNAKILEDGFLPAVDMSEAGGARLCPGYEKANREQRKAFLTAFVASISRWESNFMPDSFNGNDPGGGSYGLMQLSYPDGDVDDYKPCDINRSAENITDPKVNLQCGVSILRRQLQVNRRLLHSREERFYWRVLEVYGDDALAPFVPRSFARLRAQLPFCTL